VYLALPTERLREELVEWDLEEVEIEPLEPGVSGDVFLLAGRDQRWVAKCAYQARDEFEPGLRAAAVIATTGLATATVRTTRSGERLKMIEWPPGYHHPLAVLDFVPGSLVRITSPEAPAILGRVCGMVQARLAQVDANDLGLEDRGEEWLDYLISTNEDLGDFAWLHEVNATLAARASGAAASLGRSCGVWDGPDVLMETGTLGLVDFGHVAYQPTINFVANRLVACALGDEQRRAQFLVAFSRELTLPEQDLEWLALFELVNVAIYAKFAAWRLQNKPDRGIPADQARQRVEHLARCLIHR